jgi:hypothetical protein|tara:strand:+ start:330 stop:473 length:144 start_codon:yes stop_codon:yes gene_type:complete
VEEEEEEEEGQGFSKSNIEHSWNKLNKSEKIREQEKQKEDWLISTQK